jgi:hypothetical protein
MMRRVPALALAAPLVLAACAPDDAPARPWFRSVAAERGLDWTHVRGAEQRHWFPEIMGGGVGLLDVDRDGALDVYLVQSGELPGPSPAGSNRLFRNLGGARFADVTDERGGGDQGYGMGCACADADGDGDVDVLVTNVGPNALLVNDTGVLRDATAAAGVGDPGWGTSAAWLDHDADGDLDLYVVNYLRWSHEREIPCRSPLGGQDYCSPLNYDAPARDLLYLNAGDGRFTDVTEAAGLGAAFGNGLGVVATDVDGDGRVDLYVANDMMPNQLWMNRGDGGFDERALYAGCAVNRDGASEAGMGVVAVDVEDDGDFDLFVTHLRDETNTFYRNQGGRFTDHTPALGLGGPSLPFTGFGAGSHDFDRDGVLDIFVANGAVTRGRTTYDPADPYAEPDQLYRGERDATGALRFTEVLPRGGALAARSANSRGAAFGDLDSDGDIDVVVVNNGGPVTLLENLATGGEWIGLDLCERGGGPAEGAVARIESGGRTRTRLASAAGSYCSSSDPRILCGLGAEAGPVHVTVRWTDGAEERFGPLDTGRHHVLRRAAGTR